MGVLIVAGAGMNGMLSATLKELAGAGVAGTEAGMNGMLSATFRELAGAGVAGMEGATTLEAGLCGVLSPTLRDAAGNVVGWLGLVVPFKSISNWRAFDWLSLRGASGKFGEGKWRA